MKKTEVKRPLGESKNSYGKTIYTIEVPVKWRLFKERFKKKQSPIQFVFSPCIVRNASRISKAACELPNQLYGDTPAELAIEEIQKHQRKMIYIIAAAIQNNHLEPEKNLIRFIERNFEPEMLIEAVRYSIMQLQLEAFLNCLMIIKGTAKVLLPSNMEGNYSVAPGGDIEQSKDAAD